MNPIANQLITCSICKEGYFVPMSLYDCHHLKLGQKEYDHLTDDQITLIKSNVCADCWDEAGGGLPEVVE